MPATATTSPVLGTVRVRNARYERDLRPIEEGCDCVACAGGFSRAYLRHLDRCNEMLAPMLGTLHNLRYYQRLMAQMREAIEAGTFAAFRRSFYALRQVSSLLSLAKAGMGGATACSLWHPSRRPPASRGGARRGIISGCFRPS